jgi:hypothetical protein
LQLIHMRRLSTIKISRVRINKDYWIILFAKKSLIRQIVHQFDDHGSLNLPTCT